MQLTTEILESILEVKVFTMVQANTKKMTFERQFVLSNIFQTTYSTSSRDRERLRDEGKSGNKRVGAPPFSPEQRGAGRSKVEQKKWIKRNCPRIACELDEK